MALKKAPLMELFLTSRRSSSAFHLAFLRVSSLPRGGESCGGYGMTPGLQSRERESRGEETGDMMCGLGMCVA